MRNWPATLTGLRKVFRNLQTISLLSTIILQDESTVLKPKLTPKSIFLAIKPSINSIKPSIKFKWVHKHLILNFSSSNWIFFINMALISQQNTVKFQSLYFWTPSTNFWLFSRHFDILFLLLLFLGFFWTFFFCIFFFYVGSKNRL